MNSPAQPTRQIALTDSDVQRIADALEVLAENYHKANMVRAREGCLVLRANVLRQSNERAFQQHNSPTET